MAEDDLAQPQAILFPLTLEDRIAQASSIVTELGCLTPIIVCALASFSLSLLTPPASLRAHRLSGHL